MINITSDCDPLLISPDIKCIQLLVKNIFAEKKIKDAELSYIFCNDNFLSKLKKKHDKQTSHRVKNMWYNRDCKLENMMHLVSNRIIEYCTRFQIDTIVQGYNVNWKTKCNMGTENNRKFYRIPYSRLIKYLFDKAEIAGINIVENEESYTSRTDALALESFEDCILRCRTEHKTKRRVKRGLYKSETGNVVNADINGALNIMRKYVTKAHDYLVPELNEFISTSWKQFVFPIKHKIHELIHQLPIRGFTGLVEGS